MADHDSPAGVAPDAPAFIVGIGVSAGGLESLEQVFRPMPERTGLAFVIIQHLSPDFRSLMDELLARFTAIPICQVADGMPVVADHIYLLPPRKEMVISEGKLRLKDKDPRQSPSLPIDTFFRSLAHDAGERSIAVVLSGTGTDGSRGIRDVHLAGGLVLSESEETARFDGMPLAAAATGIVDQVVAVDQVAKSLVEYSKSPATWREQVRHAAEGPERQGMDAILQLLRTEYDIDFSSYKPTTVTRRIDRRVAMAKDPGLNEYAERLRTDAGELNALYKDLLIGVTRFFRDLDCFARLENAIVPTLLERSRPDEEVRVWVAGCATGEEAYSIAILLHEQFEKRARPVNMKVFATDVHRTSLEIASQGIYTEEGLTDVSPDRMKRFFIRKRDGFHISQDIRQHVVFAPHNLLKDAPFTGLDLVSCRNLLIYFQPAAQRKALSLFHYGLKVGGFLFLGTSESPSDLGTEFESVDEHTRIFRKRRDVRLVTDARMPLLPARPVRPVTRTSLPRPQSPYPDTLMLATYDRLLDQFMPPSVLVDENREILDIFGGAEKLLSIKRRRPSSDLVNLLSDDARLVVAGALQRAMNHGEVARFSGVRLHTDEGDQLCHVTAEPVRNVPANVVHYLVRFEPMDVPTSAPALPPAIDAGVLHGERVEGLEEELRYAKEHLQATIEELETSNEELQATNEELIASNEELQSTNEELHSVNEELYSVNAEHQRKISELYELNQDMNALLESTEVGTIFLDRDLCVRKFTPRVAEFFHVLPQDIGRRITSFAHELDHPSLVEDLRRTVIDSARIEREIYSRSGMPLFLRILPYRMGRNSEDYDGVVLTLTDITPMIVTRERLERLSGIVESSADAIIGLDLHGHILTWNGGAASMYGFTAQEAVGQSLALLIPEDRRSELGQVHQHLADAAIVEEKDTFRVRKDGTLLAVSTTQSPVRNSRGVLVGGSLIDRDISARRRAEDQLRASEGKYEDLFTHAPDMYLTIDMVTGLVIDANETFFRLAGLHANDVIGCDYARLFTDGAARAFTRFRDLGQLHDSELQVRRGDGSLIDVAVSATSMRDEHGHIVRCRAVLRDITARKQAETRIREAVTLRERFLAMLSHELRNPMHAVRSASAVVMDARSKPEQIQLAHEVMDRQTSHMSRLLDDLLDVARITQNRIELRRERVDARDLLNDAVSSVRPLFERTHVELHVEMPAVPVPVDGDPTRLVQAMSNVLSNSAKYSPAGGHVQAVMLTNGPECLITVRDGGLGLTTEMQTKIFELFVQGEQPLDRSMGGLGIGLTLARSLMELHGGSISAKSEGPGRGSEFELRFPLTKAGAVDPAAPRKSRRRCRSMVIVEDQPDSREMLKLLLELAGFEVQVAADGEEGLAMILRERPDVALVDIGLPRLNGYEVARRLRRALTTDDLYLIALTGYGQSKDVDDAREAGFDAHLVKPIQANTLRDMLESRDRELQSRELPLGSFISSPEILPISKASA